MNENRFDNIQRTLASDTSRRGVLRLLGAGVAVGALGTAGTVVPARVAKQDKGSSNANPLKKINVLGVNDAGKKIFVGKLDITEFVAEATRCLRSVPSAVG